MERDSAQFTKQRSGSTEIEPDKVDRLKEWMDEVRERRAKLSKRSSRKEC